MACNAALYPPFMKSSFSPAYAPAAILHARARLARVRAGILTSAVGLAECMIRNGHRHFYLSAVLHKKRHFEVLANEDGGGKI